MYIKPCVYTYVYVSAYVYMYVLFFATRAIIGPGDVVVF